MPIAAWFPSFASPGGRAPRGVREEAARQRGRFPHTQYTLPDVQMREGTAAGSRKFVPRLEHDQTGFAKP